MRVYIIEYQAMTATGWGSKISQEGYSTLEAAQKFVESRPGNPTRITPMWYEVTEYVRYLIHDILVREVKNDGKDG